jgi:hypothetical protein
MANVDLKTGKIYGCEEGTKTYYHEVGHLEFQENAPHGNLTRQLQDLSIKALLFICGLNIINPLNIFRGLSIAFILTSCFSEIYEEAWCWIYANKKYGDANKNKETQI